jgi:hypothetical protein
MTRAVLQTSTVTLVHALEGCLDMLTPDIIVRRRPSRRNAGTLASTRAEQERGFQVAAIRSGGLANSYHGPAIMRFMMRH